MAFCGCGATLTPLAEYARSLKTQPTEDVLPMHFPMYTVALHTLLGMSKVETHEQLKAQDLLVKTRDRQHSYHTSGLTLGTLTRSASR